MRYSNLHNHSTFSDGKFSAEENVLAAIEKNMLSIGFSDHSYTDFDPNTYCMKKGVLPDYIAEINRLKEKYKDQIEIYLGIELDGYSVLEDRTPFDYILGCCHYVRKDGMQFGVDHDKNWQIRDVAAYFDGDYIAYARMYYDGYVESVRRDKPDVLGHFDLPTKFSLVDENDPVYRKMATEALIACLEVTPVIEMNTGAISRGYRKTPYPAEYLFDEIKKHHGQITLGADSHHIDNLIYYFDESVELLRANGFQNIVQLTHGRFEEFGIV